MLKPFLSQKIEKRREFLPRLQKKISSAFLQPSVRFYIDFNQNLVIYRMQVALGR